MEIKDDNNFFYTEDGRSVFVTEKESGKNRLKTYDALTGRESSPDEDIGNDDRGLWLGDTLVTGDDKSIRIRFPDSSSEELPEAVLYGCNRARGLFFYRSPDEKRWYIYDVNQRKTVCDGESGAYANTMFFGGNRYLLNDYSVIYDMETWKPMLNLSDLGNSIYGVMTKDELPYFIVWCQESDTSETEHSSGSGTAYLYEKGGDGEIIGEIPNFVGMTNTGQVLVYDGAYDLYELSLLSAEKLKEQAEKTVGSRDLSETQRERYHLFE